MIKDIVIIGGGVAGLCAACRLVELGIKPLIIEASEYPTHKVCGEFFSPECLPLLAQWNIHPIKIHQVHLRTSAQTLTFTFPREAGSLSHIQFDPLLVHYACIRGAEILTQMKVKEIRPRQKSMKFHEIMLSTGEIVKTPILFVATGRIPSYNQKIPLTRYVGIKAHFENLPLENTLEMFSFPGAYLGIVPIENQRFNVACLVQRHQMEAIGSPEHFMQYLMSQNPILQAYFTKGKRVFSNWMQAFVPTFGIKKTPDWPHTYFIGDAAGTVPPACGIGLSMAITSGYWAAEYAIRQDAKGFKKAWRVRYSSQIFWGKLLQEAMWRPSIGNRLMKITSLFPSIANLAFSITR